MNLDDLEKMLDASTPAPWHIECMKTANYVDDKIIVTLHNLAREMIAVVRAAETLTNHGPVDFGYKQWEALDDRLETFNAKLEGMK